MGVRDRIVSLISSPGSVEAVGIQTGAYTELASAGRVVVESDKPISQKTTPEGSRVDKLDLELSYKREPNVFNTINKTAQLIMSAGYTLVGDKESVKFFTKFFDSIGSRGGELEWTELLNSVFRHQMIYGEAWNELIPAKRDDSRIVDLDLIDPKKMDYAKNSNYQIVLDDSQNPVGYVETLPAEYTAVQRFEPPEEVALLGNQLFFPSDKIAHYKLYTVGDGFYGIGLVEPVFKTIVRKLATEEAHANAIRRVGFPLRYAKIGDPQHEPTTEMIQRTVEKLKGMNYRDVIAYPYYVEQGLVEARNPERLQEYMSYLVDQIITGMGLPKALASGAGQETNRATLNRQEALTKQTLKDIVRRTLRILNKRVIIPVAESNKVRPVRIVWGEISVEELDGKARRLNDYVKSGLLTPDKNIEDLLRKIEDLPERISDETEKPEHKAD